MKNEYYRKNGQEVKIEELANLLNTTKEELALALETLNPINSIDEQVYEEGDDGVTLLDTMTESVDEASRITNKICIQQIVQNLKEQEKQVIVLRYYKGKTQTEVAKILGITQVQVSRTERKALERMKVKLAV